MLFSFFMGLLIGSFIGFFCLALVIVSADDRRE